jgi:hypothetical protein
MSKGEESITVTDYNNNSLTISCWMNFTNTATFYVNYYESFSCRVNQRERSLFFNHKIDVLTIDTPQSAIRKIEKANEDKQSSESTTKK